MAMDWMGILCNMFNRSRTTTSRSSLLFSSSTLPCSNVINSSRYCSITNRTSCCRISQMRASRQCALERIQHTCVTYKLACITRNGLRAFVLGALGLSKKSRTSSNVACKLGPPNSGGNAPPPVAPFITNPPWGTGFKRKISGA